MTLRSRSILLLATTVAGWSCTGGTSNSSSGDEQGGTVLIAAVGEPEHLLPPLISSLAAKQVVDQIFEPLATYTAGKETLGDAGFTPALAKSWSWSADSSSVTFVVDAGARWHDGRPVTASDVQFSHGLFTDSLVGSPQASSFPAIDSVRSVDSSQIRFFFADRSPERFFRLAYNLVVLPQHALAQVDKGALGTSEFARAPIGSGPFRLSRWEAGQMLELVAVDSFYRARAGVDRLIWRFGNDLNAAARSVATGEDDFVESLRPEGMTA